MKKELELYELALLLKYAPEDQLSENLTRYQTLLTEKGSQLMIKNHGKISLAYNIQGFDTATYIQVVYLGNQTINKFLNTELQRDDLVLRTITTKLVDDNVSEMFKTAA